MTSFVIVYVLVLISTFLTKVKSDCTVTEDLAKGKFISNDDASAVFLKGSVVPIGNVLKVFCDTPYIPGSVDKFTCLSDNTFDFDLVDAVCTEKQDENSSEGCLVTKQITNGKFTSSHNPNIDINVGSLIPTSYQLSLICNTGYTPGSVMYFKCQSNANFDINLENAFCNIQTQDNTTNVDGCLVTKQISNGKFISNHDASKDITIGFLIPVDYQLSLVCNMGYTPGPIVKFNCQNNAKFDVDLANAFCNTQMQTNTNNSEGCKVTNLITNGKFINDQDKDNDKSNDKGLDITIGSLIPVEHQLSVVCNAGYTPGPVKYFKCQLNNTFDANLANASCNMQMQTNTSYSAECPVTTQISNGRFINQNNANAAVAIGSVIPVGNQLTVACDAGYTAGSITLFSCQSNGNFDVNLANAFCNIQMQGNTDNSNGCLVTVNITNGRLISDQDANTDIAFGYVTPEGKELSVICDSGYASGPDNKFKCQSDNKFDVKLANAFCKEQT